MYYIKVKVANESNNTKREQRLLYHVWTGKRSRNATPKIKEKEKSQHISVKKKKLKKRLNYILHPLSLVQFQFSPLSFDRFNLVLKVSFRFKNLLRWDHFPLAV